jgi:hypothetical protein
MSVFARLWNALGRVADAVNHFADSLSALAQTFRQADAHVRQRLHLDTLPGPAETLIPAPPSAQTSLPVAQPETPPEPAASEPTSKGRRGKTSSA